MAEIIFLVAEIIFGQVADAETESSQTIEGPQSAAHSVDFMSLKIIALAGQMVVEV